MINRPTRIAVAVAAAGLTIAAPSADARTNSAVRTSPAAPTISNVSPASGSERGRTLVTITGHNFRAISKVTFGGHVGYDLDVVSSTRLTVRTPGHRAGPAGVAVFGKYGKATARTVAHGGYFFTREPVTHLASTSTPTSITLQWTMPIGDKSAGVVIRRLAGTKPPTGLTDGTLVRRTHITPSNYTDTGLTPGTEYSYRVFVRYRPYYSPGVPVTTQTLTTAETRHTWSAPTQPFGLRQGRPAAVSCVSLSFCQSVDRHGAVFTFNGTKWTQTGRIGNGSKSGTTQLVCKSSTWCEASNDTRDAYHYNGTGWTAVAVADGHGVGGNARITALSCASTSFCVAGTDDGHAFTFDGASWSSGRLIAPAIDGEPGRINTLSCPTSSFCAGGTRNSQLLTFNGVVWSARFQSAFDSVDSMSCVSAKYCVGASQFGKIIKFGGKRWSEVTNTPDVFRFESSAVDCVSASFCLVVDDSEAAVYDGAAWTKPVTPADRGLPAAASCATADFCVELTRDGAVLRRASGFSAPTVFDPASGGLSLISCAAGPFCLATDTGDQVATYQSGAWSSAASPGATIQRVSCASATFCLAVTGSGPWVFNGSSWAKSGMLKADLDLISCTSATFCLAMSSDRGKFPSVYGYNGTRWIVEPSNPSNLDTTTGLSCTAPTSCVAVSSDESADDTRSDSWTFDGRSWGHDTLISHYNVRGVSCASATFCVASGGRSVATYNGNRWTPLRDLGVGVNDVSCGSRAFCVAVGDVDGETSEFHGTAWSTPAPISARSTSLGAVSCLAGGFCLVIDGGVNAYARS